MPRWPSKEMNAAEQEIGQSPDLILPASGEIIRNDQEIAVADSPIDTDYAAQLQFMEEKVEIVVHDSTDQNAENPVQVICNGVNQFFWRNQPQVVRRKFVEVLARAKQTAITTRDVRDGNGDLSTQIGKMTALRYPFSVVSDPNPRGAAWLRSVLAQG